MVEPQTYRAADLAIEPDASAASYVFAAAALRRRPATVDGLGEGSLQGDLALRRRARADGGRRSSADATSTTVTGTGRAPRHRGRHEPALRHRADAGGGGRLRRRPDPRHRDRLHPRQGDRPRRQRGRRAPPAWASTPRRSPTASPSTPARCAPATVQTYDDHRMAMAFALAGLRARRRADRRSRAAWPRPSRATGASSTSCGTRHRPALWSDRP